MKKIVQITILLFFAFSVAESKAQLADGSIAPDFTFTDLSGNTQHLYAILDSGYTTYIDVSAAWCGPCWSYHNSGALEGLYNIYGPNGTNVLRVLYIEGELTNTTAQLHGTYAAPGGYSGSTQGDWTAGTPYPMIDLSSSTPGASNFLSSSGYHIAYFPTVYMICPDRTITLVGQETTANLYAAKASCAVATVPADAEIIFSANLNTSLQACDSVTPTFRLGNVGTSTLTSATITYKVDNVVQKVKNWTGSIATYSNALVTGTGYKLGASTPGVHTITATVSNPNGSTDPTSSNNSSNATFLLYTATGGPAISESFEASGLPASWIYSNGGDPATWMNAGLGFNSTESAQLPFHNIPPGDVDMFTLNSVSFAGISAPQITFDLSAAQSSSSSNDKLIVELSSDCGATWTPRYSKAGASLSTNGTNYFTSEYIINSSSVWRHETISNLSLFANKPNVLVRFKGTSGNGNDIYVDNINVGQAVGIEEQSNNIESVNIYPNPVTNNATINLFLNKSAHVSLSLINTIGQEVIKSESHNLGMGEQDINLSTESLSNGIYSLVIKTDDGVIIRKVAVNK